jgi:muramoyltetrapeptide carboxypeptidase
MLSYDFGSDISLYTWNSFFDVVSNAKPFGEILYPNSDKKNFKIINSGFAKGKLIGGCITLIQSLIGTNFMPDLKDKILFLEDSGEVPYRLDRMLFHLKNAGIFNELKGVIFGNTDIQRDSLERDLSIEQILIDIFKYFDYPVVYDLPFGHCKDKITIPQGVQCYLSTTEKIISFQESGVID